MMATNSSGMIMATPPTPSSSNSSKSQPATPHSATPTNNAPMLQAVYTDQNGQPVYIMNPQPTLIPLQLPPTITPTTPHQTQPTAVKLESPTVVPSVYTPTNHSGRNITVAQTFNPPKLDGLLQPLGLKLPQMNGGTLPSEAGPIRHRQSRPANERPSPVAFDGE